MAKKYTNKDVARIIEECGAIFLQEAQKIKTLEMEEHSFSYSLLKCKTSINFKDARCSFARAFNNFCVNNGEQKKVFYLPQFDGINELICRQAAYAVVKYLQNTYGIKCDYTTIMVW